MGGGRTHSSEILQKHRMTKKRWKQVGPAHLGLAERALEHIDEAASRSLLEGGYDRLRLEVMLISGRAPIERLAEFVSDFEGVHLTSMEVLALMAMAYEAIGDTERACHAAEKHLAEPNNRAMHALLGRLSKDRKNWPHTSETTLLAPESEMTDWARTILAR